MKIAGRVEKAELVKVGEWGESMLVVTIQNSETTFVFPMEVNDISHISIGEMVKLEISVTTEAKEAKQLVKPFSVDLPSLEDVDLTESTKKWAKPFVPKTAIVEPVEDDALLTEDYELPEVSAEELKELYQVPNENLVTPIELPKIHTELDTVSMDDLEKMSGEPEKVEESIAEQPKKNKLERKRPVMNIKQGVTEESKLLSVEDKDESAKTPESIESQFNQFKEGDKNGNFQSQSEWRSPFYASENQTEEEEG